MLNTTAIGLVFATVIGDAQKVAAIVSELISLILMAEEIADDIKGSQKFAIVMDALDGVISSLGLDATADKIKAKAGVVVHVIVGALNVLKLWSKYLPAAPVVPAAPAPEVQPAVLKPSDAMKLASGNAS